MESHTSYKEKTTLPRAFADVSEFVCVTALDPGMTPGLSPCLSLGILTQFPFELNFTVVNITIDYFTVTFKTDFSDFLGPTDPCSTAVHMEPFSTLVLKSLT